MNFPKYWFQNIIYNMFHQNKIPLYNFYNVNGYNMYLKYKESKF
jgi:hypothetical protein